MKNKTLIYLVVGGLLLWIWSKARAFRSLDLRPGVPNNFRLSGGTVEFQLPLTAFNASGTALNIGGLDLRVYAEGVYVGRAYIQQGYTIAGTGTTVIPAYVRVSLVDIASGIPAFMQGSQDQVIELTFDGVANVEGVYAPIKISQRFLFPKIR